MRIIKITAALLLLSIPLVLNSCERERESQQIAYEAPLYGPGAPPAEQSKLEPGMETRRLELNLEVNEWVLGEGRRLYNWYNCSGCHFNGGGGIGPPLMDEEWIYGSQPQNIADSIINGRPQGMPTYGNKIPAAHLAPIVVYVRSLSGLGTEEPTPTPLPAKQKEESTQKPGVREQQQQSE